MKILSRKVLMVTMVFILTLSLFAGCKQKENNNSSTSVDNSKKQTEKNEPTKEPTKEPVKDPVKITFYTWNNKPDENGINIEQKVIDAFEAENSDVKVELNVIADNDSVAFMQQMDLLLMGGEQVDVMSLPNMQGYLDKANKGMIIPIDNYLEGTSVSDLYYVDTTAVDGKVYGLPTITNTWFVLLNKDMLDEAGLSVPPLDWTWDDYREYAKALTKGEGASKIYGSYMHTWGGFKYLGLQQAYDFDPLLKPDGSNNLDDPNFRKWLQYMYDLESVDKSQIPYFDAIASNLAYRDIFFQGKAAMIPIGSWMIKDISADEFPHDFVTTFAAMPKMEGHKAGNFNGGSVFMTMTNTTKDHDASYRFLKFYADNAPIITFGGFPSLKGIDPQPVLKNMISKPELYDLDALNSVIGNPNATNNIFKNIYSYTKKVADAVNEEFEKFLVGGQSIDDAINTAKKRVDDILAAE